MSRDRLYENGRRFDKLERYFKEGKFDGFASLKRIVMDEAFRLSRDPNLSPEERRIAALRVRRIRDMVAGK